MSLIWVWWYSLVCDVEYGKKEYGKNIDVNDGKYECKTVKYVKYGCKW